MKDPLSMPWRRRSRSPSKARLSAARRWLQASAIWLGLLFLGGTLQGFFLQPPLQDRLCRWHPLTPTCRALDLGNLPTEAELSDFAAAQAAGTPEALNAFRDRHKDSPLDAEALRALARCRDVPTPFPVTHRLAVEQTQTPTATGSAEAGAEALALAQAHRLCRPFGESEMFRIVQVRIERRALDCQSLGAHRMCTWRGEAVCELEELRPVSRCDPPADD